MAHVHKPIRMSAAKIEEAVRTYNRDPFQGFLALLLDAVPTQDEIQAFANRHPDRWAKAMTMVAGLAGYSPQAVTEASVTTNLNEISDAALFARLAAAKSQLERLRVRS